MKNLRKLYAKLLLTLIVHNFSRVPYSVSTVWVRHYLKSCLIQKKPYTILFARKSVLGDDVRAISKLLGYSILPIDRSLLRSIANHFYTFTSSHHLPNENTRTPNTSRRISFKDYYQNYLLPLLRSLSVSCWLSSDSLYYYESPFQEAAVLNGLPSLVLHKESFKSPIQHSAWRKYLQDNFHTLPITRIATLNSEMFLTYTNYSALATNQIYLTGSPRFHRLYIETLSSPKRKICESRKRVVFFASSPTAGFPRFGYNTFYSSALDSYGITPDAFHCIEDLWHTISQKIYDDSIIFASNYPAFDVVYKCKQGFNYSHSTSIIPSTNWSTTSGSSNESLFKDTVACIGFNTSALLESVFRGIPTFTPLVELSESTEPFIMDYGKAVLTYSSVDELYNSIEYPLSTNPVDQYSLLSHAQTDGAYSSPLDLIALKSFFES